MEHLYQILWRAELIGAAFIFILLLFVKAPYGKFVKGGWGPCLNPRISWILMELPVLLLPVYFFILAGNYSLPGKSIFLLIWQLHYVQRTLVYPFLLNRKTHKMPILIILLSLIFNSMNGYINGYGVFLRKDLAPRWFTSPPFLIGTLLFLGGFFLNLHSDHILRTLRAPGEEDYRIPHQGLFRLICSPHYLGEIIEWVGWAILTWSLAGVVFFFFTMANLVPRALANLSWYRSNFPNFPRNRKAIFPYLL